MIRARTRALAVVVMVMSVLATGFVAADVGTQRSAELHIDEPHWADGEVQVHSGGNVTTYDVEGAEVEIVPQNFNRSNVVDYGVEGPGDISVDQQTGEYVLSAEKNGTYTVWWDVARPKTVTRTRNNSTVTETVVTKRRYTARINAKKVHMAHLKQGRLGEMKKHATSWENFKEEVQSDTVAWEDAPMDEMANLAVRLIQLRYNPSYALTGKVGAILLTLVMTLAGGFLLTLGAAYHYGSRRADIQYVHERESVDIERSYAEDVLEELEGAELKAEFEGIDWNDLYPDHVAREWREHWAETPLLGWLKLYEMVMPRNLIADKLRVMGANGWVAIREEGTDDVRLERRAAVADGGDGEEIVDDLSDPDDETVTQLDWNDSDLINFDIRKADNIPDLTDDELSGLTLDELIECFDEDLERFDSARDDYGQYLLEFIEEVLRLDYTDRDGRVKDTKHALNILLRGDRVLDQRYNLPLAGMIAEHIHLAHVREDVGEAAGDYAGAVKRGEV